MINLFANSHILKLNFLLEDAAAMFFNRDDLLQFAITLFSIVLALTSAGILMASADTGKFSRHVLEQLTTTPQ